MRVGIWTNLFGSLFRVRVHGTMRCWGREIFRRLYFILYRKTSWCCNRRVSNVCHPSLPCMCVTLVVRATVVMHYDVGSRLLIHILISVLLAYCRLPPLLSVWRDIGFVWVDLDAMPLSRSKSSPVPEVVAGFLPNDTASYRLWLLCSYWSNIYLM